VDLASTMQIAPLAVAGSLVVLAAGGAVRLTIVTYRYIRATPLQRERIRHAWRINRRWRRLAPNVGLARIDENTRGRQGANGGTAKPITVVPKMKAFPEPWGIRAVIQTIPKVGVQEVEKAGAWLADAWQCESVEVTRLQAGLVEIRGIVGDPLADHHPYVWPEPGDWALPMGHNPWMRQLAIPLRQLSGIKVAGLPGYGKTMLMLAWVASLANRPEFQFAVFDGKTSDARYGDWGQAGERALFVVGDNPETANQRLTELVRLLKDRPAALVEERGTHKFWKTGPTERNPLVLVVMDECHNYADTKGLTGKDKQVIESNQRMMQTISKEGRGLGVIGIFGTQKQTGDAIPTAVRDNLEVGVCFATFTIDAAEAALGSGIRKDEPNQPIALVDKDTNVGVCVVTGVPGLGGRYDRLRVGDLDEDQLPGYIASTARFRRDVIPAAAPVVVDVSSDSTEDAGAGQTVPLQKKPRRTRKAS
jgi:DNA segregation ATPase FtsK/SpoIIIE, S-DNA-T family